MSGSNIIQSLATGMDVLALLAEAEDGLRVRDVAAKTGIKPPAAHNLLRTLRAKGFVTRDATAPIYRLGPRLRELVASEDAGRFFGGIESAMLSLGEALPDATATFAQPINGEIAVRRRLSAGSFGDIRVPSGFSLSLYASASGLAILAFCHDHSSLTLQHRHPLLEEGARLWSPPETLDDYLEQVRRQGYALHPYANERHLAVASPVWDGREQFAGAMGVSRTAARGQAFDGGAVAVTVEQLQRVLSKTDAAVRSVWAESRQKRKTNHGKRTGTAADNSA